MQFIKKMLFVQLLIKVVKSNKLFKVKIRKNYTYPFNLILNVQCLPNHSIWLIYPTKLPIFYRVNCNVSFYTQNNKNIMHRNNKKMKEKGKGKKRKRNDLSDVFFFLDFF